MTALARIGRPTADVIGAAGRMKFLPVRYDGCDTPLPRFVTDAQPQHNPARRLGDGATHFHSAEVADG